MSDATPTLRVKPSHPSQGDWVVIDAASFDPAVHELAEGETHVDPVDPVDPVKTGKQKQAAKVARK